MSKIKCPANAKLIRLKSGGNVCNICGCEFFSHQTFVAHTAEDIPDGFGTVNNVKATPLIKELAKASPDDELPKELTAEKEEEKIDAEIEKEIDGIESPPIDPNYKLEDHLPTSEELNDLLDNTAPATDESKQKGQNCLHSESKVNKNSDDNLVKARDTIYNLFPYSEDIDNNSEYSWPTENQVMNILVELKQSLLLSHKTVDVEGMENQVYLLAEHMYDYVYPPSEIPSERTEGIREMEKELWEYFNNYFFITEYVKPCKCEEVIQTFTNDFNEQIRANDEQSKLISQLKSKCEELNKMLDMRIAANKEMQKVVGKIFDENAQLQSKIADKDTLVKLNKLVNILLNESVKKLTLDLTKARKNYRKTRDKLGTLHSKYNALKIKLENE